MRKNQPGIHPPNQLHHLAEGSLVIEYIQVIFLEAGKGSAEQPGRIGRLAAADAGNDGGSIVRAAAVAPGHDGGVELEAAVGKMQQCSRRHELHVVSVREYGENRVRLCPRVSFNQALDAPTPKFLFCYQDKTIFCTKSHRDQ